MPFIEFDDDVTLEEREYVAHLLEDIEANREELALLLDIELPIEVPEN